MDASTPEEAQKILSQLRGPDGIPAFRAAVAEELEKRKTIIVAVQGEIKAYTTVLRLIDTLAGLANGQPQGDPTVYPRDASQDPVLYGAVPDEADAHVVEREERVKDGRCLYKAPSTEGGKWCARKLRTKAEKEIGYCKTHAEHLGIELKKK